MSVAIKTTSAPMPGGHYSQAVRTGDFLFISGQLPIDRNGNLVKASVAQEAIQALENIRAIVEAADGTIANIVQCTIYISDIEHWAEVNKVYGAFFRKGSGATCPHCGARQRDALWRSHRNSSHGVVEPSVSGHKEDQQTLNGFGLGTAQPILNVLGTSRISGSIQYSGKCGPAVLIPQLPPVREPQKPIHRILPTPSGRNCLTSQTSNFSTKTKPSPEGGSGEAET